VGDRGGCCMQSKSPETRGTKAASIGSAAASESGLHESLLLTAEAAAASSDRTTAILLAMKSPPSSPTHRPPSPPVASSPNIDKKRPARPRTKKSDAAAASEVAQPQEQKSQLKAEIARQQAEIAMLQTQVARQQAELDDRSHQPAAATETAQRLQQEIRLKAEIARQQTDVARLQAETGRQQAEIGRQQAEIASQHAEIASQRAEIARQRAEIARQQAELERAVLQQDQNARLEGEVARQRDEILRQQAELSERSRQQTELPAENELCAENERLRSQLAGFLYVQRTSPIRKAASEIISAMGRRGERRKLDPVLRAAKGFAEGSKTFRFDRRSAKSAALEKMAGPEESSSPAHVHAASPAVASSRETAVAPPPEVEAVANEELASMRRRVEEITRRDEAEAARPPPMPAIDEPSAAAPMLLAGGQLLVRLPDGARASGMSAQLVAVAGSSAVRILGDGTWPLAYDGCSQRALPWRPPSSGWLGWESALRHDAAALPSPAAKSLSGLREAREAFSTTAEAPLLQAALDAIEKHAEAVVTAAGSLSVLDGLLAPRACEAREAIAEACRSFDVDLPAQVAGWWTPARKEEEEAIYKLRTRKGPDGSVVTVPEERLSPAEREEIQRLKRELAPGHEMKLKLQQMQQQLRTATEGLEGLLTPAALEALAVEALQSSGGVGVRRYGSGQLLTVRLAGSWHDAEVRPAKLRTRALCIDGCPARLPAPRTICSICGAHDFARVVQSVPVPGAHDFARVVQSVPYRALPCPLVTGGGSRRGGPHRASFGGREWYQPAGPGGAAPVESRATRAARR
jgi:hypothetical protein